MIGEIKNAQGERLDYTFTPGEEGRGDLVVIGHGVTANKDREWAVVLAGRLRDARIASLRISFSGNGDSEGDFRRSTVTKEVEDLGAVLDATGYFRVAYAGHSMGGAVGVLRASRDERIRFLVSLAGMVHVADFCDRKFGALTPDRDLMWDKPECPLSREFVDDMRATGSVVDRGADVAVPWLLVHGTADTVVPLRDSLDILGRAGGSAELVQLEGVDHVFSGEGAEQMADAVVRWLSERLREGR